MAKSITKRHEQLIAEKNDIEEKIRDLETKLSDGIITLLKQHGAFKTHYPLLCGALIETITSLKEYPQKHDAWTESGQKFITSQQRQKNKSSKSERTNNERNDSQRAA